MVQRAVEARRAGAFADRILFLGHSTVLIELDGVRLVTDPLLRARVAHLRRQVPSIAAGACADPDAVLISHLHHDHLDLPSLRSLGRSARLLVPAGAGRWLARRGFTRVEEMRAGDQTSVGTLSVTAVPARHDGHRLATRTRAAPLGYIVKGSQTIYFAGDTALFDDMARLVSGLDVALLPVAGWAPKLGPGHMDALEAARAALLLRPRVAIPIHWGTLLPIGMGARHRARLADPPRLFAEHLARLAPDVEARILAPGTSTRL